MLDFAVQSKYVQNTCWHTFALLNKRAQNYLFTRLCYPRHAFVIVNKYALKHLFARLCHPNQMWTKIRVCTPTLSQAKSCKSTFLHVSAVASKYAQNTSLHAIAILSKWAQRYFCNTSATQSKVGQFFRVCSHLLYKANLIKIWILIIFAYLRKRIQY